MTPQDFSDRSIDPANSSLEPPPIVGPPHHHAPAAPPIVRSARPSNDGGPTRRGFRLYPVTLVIVIAFFGWLLIFPIVTSSPDLFDTISGRMSRFVGSLVFAGIVAALAWLVAGKSSWAGNVILCVILGLHATGTVLWDVRAMHARRDRENAARLESLNQEISNEIKQQIESGQHVGVGVDDFRRRVNQLAEIAGDSNDLSAKAGRAMAAALGEIEPQVAAYTAAMNAMAESGGLDVTQIKSLEVLDERIRSIQEFRDANEAFLAEYSGIPDRVGAILLNQDVSASDATKFSKEVLREPKFKLQIEIRESDREVADVGLQILGLLRSEWDAWSFDAEQGAVLFEDENQIAPFNKLNEQLQQATDRASQLLKRLAVLMETPTTP